MIGYGVEYSNTIANLCGSALEIGYGVECSNKIANLFGIALEVGYGAEFGNNPKVGVQLPEWQIHYCVCVRAGKRFARKPSFCSG